MKMGVVSMIVDFKPLITREINCFDNALANIANWFGEGYIYGEGYLYIFAQSLPFTYKNWDYVIGNNIFFSQKPKFELIEKYFGASHCYYEGFPPDRLLEIIKAEIDSNNPVFIGFDTYWMPWDIKYQNEHFYYHYCIAVGYDDNSVFIADPFKGFVDFKPLSIEYFLKGIGTCTTFSKRAGFISEKVHWLTVLEDAFKSYNYNQGDRCFLNSLRLLANEIEDKMKFDVEFKGLSKQLAWQAPIVKNLLEIKNYRNVFSNLLEYIYTNYYRHESIIALSKFYKKLASMWLKTHNHLYKGFLVNNIAVKYSVAKKIKEIINYEHEAIIKLSDIIGRDKKISC